MGAALCSNGNKVVVVKPNKVKASAQLTGAKKGSRDVDITDKDLSNKKQANAIKRENEKLWKAVENNDLAAAELYLDFNEIGESDLYDANGNTMLHTAAELGHAEMMMVLIERTGAKADMVNNTLATPLHMACRSNRPAVVKFLIG